MEVLFQFNTWLVILGTALVLRQLLVIFSAEQGRKQDLVKKLYKARTEFRISVLVPYLDSRSLPRLLHLLRLIEEQEYPRSRVTVHVGCTRENADDLDPEKLKPNVRRWIYPENKAGFGQMTSWLIERCLAAGDAGLMVFLKPDDVIKPDFFQSIVAVGFENPVVQGYVATKRRPTTPLEHVVALSRRLINRIGNAGRYHLGLSCRLQDSGWVIKQEVLEMIPYRRGLDLDNLEYTLRLNLANFRVTWAPHVVVYSDEPIRFLPYLTDCVGAFFNRFQIALGYSLPLLFRSLVRLDFSYFEEFLTVLKPPHFITGLLLSVIAAAAWFSPFMVPGSAEVWALFALSVVVLNLLSLVVARCKANDYVTAIFWTPLVYALGLLASPIAAANCLVSLAMGTAGSKSPRSYKSQTRTRFNETIDPEPSMFDTAHHQEAIIRDMLVQHAPDEDEMGQYRRERFGRRYQNYAHQIPASTTTIPEAPRTPIKQARVIEKTVPISNGQRQVNCILKMKTDYNGQGEELYQMTLEYKSLSFSTQQYRILDQAFYELESKLMSRGVSIVTCGSCGYFYNPTADVPGAVKNAGVCLFGKKGRDVNLSTDSVTVVSQACPYHCDIESREAIVREWRESLSTASL